MIINELQSRHPLPEVAIAISQLTGDALTNLSDKMNAFFQTAIQSAKEVHVTINPSSEGILELNQVEDGHHVDMDVTSGVIWFVPGDSECTTLTIGMAGNCHEDEWLLGRWTTTRSKSVPGYDIMSDDVMPVVQRNIREQLGY